MIALLEQDCQLAINEMIAAKVWDRWNALLVDTTGDALSEGGQSLAELDRLEEFEKFLLSLNQEQIPTFHHFCDGLYVREIHAKRDTVLIGHEHQHECINHMRTGRVLTIINGQAREFRAGFMGKSGAHTRKASIVLEDMRWATVHPNPDNETDIAKLEERYLIKSPTFLALSK